MKRLFVALGLVLCAASFASVSSAEVVKWRTENLKWRTSAANTAGFVDSLTASINGAVQTVDTTAAFSMDRLMVPHDGAVNTTAYGLFKVWISAPLFTSVDTLFIAMETSPDAVNWSTNASFSNMVVGTAGDEAVQLHFQGDTDAGVLNAWGAPFIRFRVRADGNTGSIAAASEIRITYPSAE